MIVGWMLYSTTVALLLGLAALAAERCCRVWRVQGRWVWAAALIGTLALSSLGLMRAVSGEIAPHLPDGQVTSASGVTAGMPARTGLGVGVSEVIREWAAVRAQAATRLYGSIPRGGRLEVAALASWGFCSLGLFLVFAAALLRMRNARRGWRSYRIGDVPVLVSPTAGPAVVGLLRPRIVVPAWLLDESAERQRIVVRHETEHVRARDPLLLAGACAAVCVLPWNAAIWWLLKRTRLAVELDCDARVLRGGVVPAVYGALLLRVAAQAPMPRLRSPALIGSTTQLERRLLAMTDMRRAMRRTATPVSALSAVLLAAAACTTDLPTAAAVDAMDVTDAQRRAEQVGLLVTAGEAPLLFFVDGYITTADDARGISADRIRSVEVIRGAAAREQFGEQAAGGVVKITTGAGDVDPAASPAAEPLTSAERRARVEQAGEAAKLRLRGVTGTAPEASPLILVDGVVTDNAAMQALDPASIARIEVVKGLTARRTYQDARAANGVILITTRK